MLCNRCQRLFEPFENVAVTKDGVYCELCSRTNDICCMPIRKAKIDAAGEKLFFYNRKGR